MNLRKPDTINQTIIFPENEPPSNKILNLLRKFSLDAANVFLLNLSRPDLLLHFPGFLRVPAKQEKAGGQPVQPVDGPEVLEAVLLRQDEDHRVVAVAAARMNLKKNVKWSIKDSLNLYTLSKLDLFGGGKGGRGVLLEFR